MQQTPTANIGTMSVAVYDEKLLAEKRKNWATFGQKTYLDIADMEAKVAKVKEKYTVADKDGVAILQFPNSITELEQAIKDVNYTYTLLEDTVKKHTEPLNAFVDKLKAPMKELFYESKTTGKMGVIAEMQAHLFHLKKLEQERVNEANRRIAFAQQLKDGLLRDMYAKQANNKTFIISDGNKLLNDYLGRGLTIEQARNEYKAIDTKGKLQNAFTWQPPTPAIDDFNRPIIEEVVATYNVSIPSFIKEYNAYIGQIFADYDNKLKQVVLQAEQSRLELERVEAEQQAILAQKEAMIKLSTVAMPKEQPMREGSALKKVWEARFDYTNGKCFLSAAQILHTHYDLIMKNLAKRNNNYGDLCPDMIAKALSKIKNADPKFDIIGIEGFSFVEIEKL